MGLGFDGACHWRENITGAEDLVVTADWDLRINYNLRVHPKNKGNPWKRREIKYYISVFMVSVNRREVKTISACSHECHGNVCEIKTLLTIRPKMFPAQATRKTDTSKSLQSPFVLRHFSP